MNPISMNMKHKKKFLSVIKHIMLIFLVLVLTGYATVSNDIKNEIDTNISDKNIKVALLQLSPLGANVDANLKKGEEFCRKAKSLGADIALFPEMWSIGYSRFHWPGTQFSPENFPLSLEDWKAKAVDNRSKFIIHFQHLAIELNMAIVITYLEKWNGLPRNSSSVIDSKGNILMTYAKVHTSDFKAMESNCTPGADFYVCDLPVKGDVIKIGIMTCFDREFPESARILMLKGAELILTPNACRLEEKRINQFQTRAYENAVGVAMTNYPVPN
jgi:N-carbamoylputrescine amidase